METRRGKVGILAVGAGLVVYGLMFDMVVTTIGGVAAMGAAGVALAVHGRRTHD